MISIVITDLFSYFTRLSGNKTQEYFLNNKQLKRDFSQLQP